MLREEAPKRGENRERCLLLSGLTNLVAYQSTPRQRKGAAHMPQPGSAGSVMPLPRGYRQVIMQHSGWRRSPPIRARWTPDAPTVTPPRSAPEVRSFGSDSKAGSGGPARHQQPVGRLVFNRLATTRPERTVTWCLPIADVRVDRGDVLPASVHRGTGQDAQRWQEVQLAGLRAV